MNIMIGSIGLCTQSSYNISGSGRLVFLLFLALVDGINQVSSSQDFGEERGQLDVIIEIFIFISFSRSIYIL